MRQLPPRRVGLPVALAAATVAVGIGLWAQQGTRPVHDTAVLGGRPSASATPAQPTPTPTRAAPSSAAPSPSASASHSSASGTARHQSAQRGGTQSTGADSAAAIKAKAERLTKDIGKAKLTITTPKPAPLPTSITVGG